jgi:hypothetical protein
MIHKYSSFAVVLVAAALTLFLAGCVSIPNTGPEAPNYKAEVRIVNLDPGLVTTTLSMADGPDFLTSATIPVGAPGIEGTYATYPAGAKRLIFDLGGVADTNVTTFTTDMHGSLYIVPPRGPGDRLRFVADRYIFAAAGLKDTARVWFYNAVARFDTIKVIQLTPRDSVSFVRDTLATRLAFGATARAGKVASGVTAKYYLMRGAGGAVLDSLTVTGATLSDYTVCVYDTLAATKLKHLIMKNN